LFEVYYYPYLHYVRYNVRYTVNYFHCMRYLITYIVNYFHCMRYLITYIVWCFKYLTMCDVFNNYEPWAMSHAKLKFVKLKLVLPRDRSSSRYCVLVLEWGRLDIWFPRYRTCKIKYPSSLIKPRFRHFRKKEVSRCDKSLLS